MPDIATPPENIDTTITAGMTPADWLRACFACFVWFDQPDMAEWAKAKLAEIADEIDEPAEDIDAANDIVLTVANEPRVNLASLEPPYGVAAGSRLAGLAYKLAIRERIAAKPEPAWTMRLAQINQRTAIEKQAADLKWSIECLGGHPLLTEALIAADLAMRILGKWHDAGEPGAAVVNRNIADV